ncbi:MAG: hypothetical protein GHCLOJNM_01177 [bacterium]|nr:hypothetical protein [bacterium]
MKPRIVRTKNTVGNRTSMQTVNKNGTITEDLTWTLEYNGLNQLDRRFSGASWTGANGDTRIDYAYDTNGNLTQALKETKVGGVWSQAEKWDYTWNVRDQLIRAVKYTTGANNVGSVEYEYCLSCDGALSPSPPALSRVRERGPTAGPRILSRPIGAGADSHSHTARREKGFTRQRGFSVSASMSQRSLHPPHPSPPSVSFL